ncbi:MAG: MBOAT family protein [Salibacteraceae bacterium]
MALTASLVVNIGMLFVFKYADWFLTDLTSISATWAHDLPYFKDGLNLVLPVGISFYTFQTLSYTIDVYYGRVSAEKNPFKFALFVSYFPQLVAGPIERFGRLHHQLFKDQKLEYHTIRSGIRLMLWGMFIKMCVADNLAPIVDQVFASSSEASSAQLLSGMMSFSLQIYAEFQGYSLIAIGAARTMGVNLIYNFNAPYFARSIREFWSRWHISLSTWFRDYLFIPLGGSRKSNGRIALNILIVFLISGLWHGANLTFIAWGGLHGLVYLAQRWITIKGRGLLIQMSQWLLTLLVVCIAWVFFRSSDVTSALAYIWRMFNAESSDLSIVWDPIVLAFAGLFIASDFVLKHGDLSDWLDRQSFLLRWVTYSFLLYSILGFAGTVNHPFIYFQF